MRLIDVGRYCATTFRFFPSSLHVGFGAYVADHIDQCRVHLRLVSIHSSLLNFSPLWQARSFAAKTSYGRLAVALDDLHYGRCIIDPLWQAGYARLLWQAIRDPRTKLWQAFVLFYYARLSLCGFCIKTLYPPVFLGASRQNRITALAFARSPRAASFFC